MRTNSLAVSDTENRYYTFQRDSNKRYVVRCIAEQFTLTGIQYRQISETSGLSYKAAKKAMIEAEKNLQAAHEKYINGSSHSAHKKSPAKPKAS